MLELSEWAQRVGGELGGFVVEPVHDWGVYLTHPDGRRLFVRVGLSGADAQRVRISGDIPDGGTISVARGRAPADVARDVTRRLLTGNAETLALDATQEKS